MTDEELRLQVRRVIFEDLGVGPRQLHRIIREAIRDEVREQVRKHMLANPGWKEDVTETVRQLGYEVTSLIQETTSTLHGVRTKVNEDTQALHNSVATTATILNAAVQNRIASLTSDGQISHLVQLAVDKWWTSTHNTAELRNEMTTAARKAAMEAADHFINSNFNVTIQPLPGRKIMLRNTTPENATPSP